MSLATKNKFFALTLIPLLMAGYASENCRAQSADQGAMPPPSSDASTDTTGYFSQHFSADALAHRRSDD